MKRSLAHILALALMLALAACYRGPRPGQIGSPAPDFTIQDGNRTVALRDFRGKVVLLNFWATWCPPCVEEMPSLVDLQKRMGDRITVLAVSVDMDGDAFTKFVKDRKVDLLAVRDADQRSNSLYGTFKFPESYVIDREGKIRRKFIGPVNWNDPEIEKYLAGL
ncbi:MAG: TlpA family protein disulfide reductase [Terriglobales bacterium]